MSGKWNYIYFNYHQITDARDGQSRTIRQFQFIEWPEQVSMDLFSEAVIVRNY